MLILDRGRLLVLSPKSKPHVSQTREENFIEAGLGIKKEGKHRLDGVDSKLNSLCEQQSCEPV